MTDDNPPQYDPALEDALDTDEKKGQPLNIRIRLKKTYHDVTVYSTDTVESLKKKLGNDWVIRWNVITLFGIVGELQNEKTFAESRVVDGTVLGLVLPPGAKIQEQLIYKTKVKSAKEKAADKAKADAIAAIPIPKENEISLKVRVNKKTHIVCVASNGTVLSVKEALKPLLGLRIAKMVLYGVTGALKDESTMDELGYKSGTLLGFDHDQIKVDSEHKINKRAYESYVKRTGDDVLNLTISSFWTKFEVAVKLNETIGSLKVQLQKLSNMLPQHIQLYKFSNGIELDDIQLFSEVDLKNDEVVILEYTEQFDHNPEDPNAHRESRIPIEPDPIRPDYVADYISKSRRLLFVICWDTIMRILYFSVNVTGNVSYVQDWIAPVLGALIVLQFITFALLYTDQTSKCYSAISSMVQSLAMCAHWMVLSSGYMDAAPSNYMTIVAVLTLICMFSFWCHVQVFDEMDACRDSELTEVRRQLGIPEPEED